MSKPKFQTEWEEIDEEYQQLQVTQIKSATSSRVSLLAFLAPARHRWLWQPVTVVATLLWIAPSHSSFILILVVNAASSLSPVAISEESVVF